MSDNRKSNNFKIFFIKLISISIAAIIVINVLFNILISNIPYVDTLISLTELESRRQHADKLRDSISELLKKDSIIKQEDKILLYKFYKKLESEFEDVKK